MSAAADPLLGDEGDGEDTELRVRVYDNGMVAVDATHLEMSWMEAMRLAAILIRAADEAAWVCGAAEQTVATVREEILRTVFEDDDD